MVRGRSAAGLSSSAGASGESLVRGGVDIFVAWVGVEWRRR
jgi:hypothetical protein